MFNVRPQSRGFGLNVEPLEDSPGFRMNANGTLRDASFGDQPERYLPGLHNFRPPDELVPGLSVNAGGSIRNASAPSAKNYLNVSDNPFGILEELGTNAFTSVGDGLVSPYLTYGSAFLNGLRRAPTFDEGEHGGATNPLLANAPFFSGSSTAGLPPVALPSPIPTGWLDPGNGLCLPPSSSSYTANPLPMRPSFVGPTPDDGLSGANQRDARSEVWPPPVGAADPNIVRVAYGDQAAVNDEVQVAQASTPGGPATLPSTQSPGRGYGTIPQSQIESGMTKLQRQINRDQAFRELTRQAQTAGEARYALPDDWEATKPADVVDDIKRAAERHGVPLQLLARLLYQEGRFGEVARGRKPLVMESRELNRPIGYAQMTRNTLEDLKTRARQRGDTARAEELKAYSLANRAQSFDAAAEQLAYLSRHLGGNWSKAVAAYNVGPTAMKNWFDVAQDPTDKNDMQNDPRFFATRTTGRDGKLLPEEQLKQSDKWKEMSAYLRAVLRGAAEDPATSDMYEYQPPRQYRARKPIPPRVPGR